MGTYTSDRLKENLREERREENPWDEYENLPGPDDWQHDAREYAEDPSKLVKEAGEYLSKLGGPKAVHQDHVVQIIKAMDGGEEALMDVTGADPDKPADTNNRTFRIHVTKALREDADVMELDDDAYYRYKEADGD